MFCFFLCFLREVGGIGDSDGDVGPMGMGRIRHEWTPTPEGVSPPREGYMWLRDGEWRIEACVEGEAVKG